MRPHGEGAVVGPLGQQLGGYQEFRPAPPLGWLLEAVWVHRTPRDLPLAPEATHRVLPDPALSLAFTCYRGEDGAPREPRLLLVGPVDTVRWFPLRPGFEMAAVKLKLEWAAALLACEPRDHRNALDDLGSIAPALAEPLFDALLRTRTAGEATRTLVVALGGRAARAHIRPQRAARHAMEAMRRSAGRASVADLSATLGVSTRYLRRAVRAEAGMALKRFGRTLRLLGVLTDADRQARPGWARLAAEAGFFDQSHLVRECRALTGLPPRRLHRERRAEAEISNPR